MYMCKLINCIADFDGNEVGCFASVIHNYPYLAISFLSLGQSYDEIHVDVLPSID
jgi:hypothetical protein